MGTITVNNVGKAYKQYPTRWSRLAEWLDPRNKPRHNLHWVLQDINFTVKPGEAVGIIGINGAGKSTLLKMITGTTQPTTGSIHMSGRVAALLELGMGFHPEFTGRQNAYMAGQLLGYSIEELNELMPGIELFANIGDYIDQPVRVYSSGMQVRLAYSVATAKRPQILIVDEALGVGDSAFQRKCFQHIEKCRKAGTTLLLVSHDIETVKKICDRALFLKDGQVAKLGTAKLVCDEYERFLFGTAEKEPNKINSPNDKPTKYDPSLEVESEIKYGNGIVDIEKSWLTDLNGNTINIIESSTPFKFIYKVCFHANIENPIFSMMIKSREGVSLYGVDSTTSPSIAKIHLTGSSSHIEFTLENPLAPGLYYLNCGVKSLNENGEFFLARRIDTAVIRIISSEDTTTMSGMIEMKAQIDIRCASEKRM